MKEIQRGVLTIAFGSDYYIKMALSLGQSLRRFSPKIPRAIVTDSVDIEITKNFTHVIAINPKWGKDVVQKLHIDKYTPFDETLFIDSDSLVVKNLLFAFNLFDSKDAVALGTDYFYPGDECHFADISLVCSKLNIKKIPKFNGGVYYINKYGLQQSVFELARKYLDNYQQLGFCDFRNNIPADELLIGAAIESLGSSRINDHGKIMRTPFGLSGKLVVDMIKGISNFNKSGHLVSPAIVHFAGEWVKSPVYKRETAKLKYLSQEGYFGKINATIYHFKFELFQGILKLFKFVWNILPKRIRWFIYGLRNKYKSFNAIF